MANKATSSDPTVAALALEVIRLRRELDELRASLATEVRTKRLVVVDEHGAERIRADFSDEACGVVVESGQGSIRVQASMVVTDTGASFCSMAGGGVGFILTSESPSDDDDGGVGFNIADRRGWCQVDTKDGLTLFERDGPASRAMMMTLDEVEAS